MFIAVIEKDPILFAAIKSALNAGETTPARIQQIDSVVMALARIGGGDVEGIFFDISNQREKEGNSVAARRLLAGSGGAPLLVLCDAGDEAIAERAVEAGAAAYSIKDSAADLARAVAKVFSRPKSDAAPAIECGASGQRKILAAEDHEDNRVLIEAYLEPEGVDVDFAENGEVAVDRVKQGSYQLVLMDLQMPVMDGYMATRAIREWEKSEGHSAIPIFILTAHVLKGETERSREAGCSGYLSKPISKGRLMAAIEPILRPKTQHNNGESAASIDKIRALAPVYLSRRRDELPLLHQLIDEARFDEISVLAHNIKGSATGYGFPAFRVLGSELEHAAKGKSEKDVRMHLLSLEACLVQLEQK